jgi:hypothetical protein
MPPLYNYNRFAPAPTTRQPAPYNPAPRTYIPGGNKPYGSGSPSDIPSVGSRDTLRPMPPSAGVDRSAPSVFGSAPGTDYELQVQDLINRILSGDNATKTALTNTRALDNIQAQMAARGLSNSGVAGAALGAQNADALAYLSEDQFKRQQVVGQLLQFQQQLKANEPGAGEQLGSFISGLLPLILTFI